MIKHQHEKIKSHIQLSLSVVKGFLIENVRVKDIDQILQNHVMEYNKNILAFKCFCDIKNERFSGKMMLRWLCNPNIYLAGKLQSI